MVEHNVQSMKDKNKLTFIFVFHVLALVWILRNLTHEQGMLRKSGPIPMRIIQSTANGIAPLDSFLPPGVNTLVFDDNLCIDYFRTNPLAEFPDITDVFLSIPRGEHKSDLFRYFYLYQNGGIWIDSDIVLNVSLARLVQEYTFFSVWVPLSHRPHIFQGLLGAVPLHPIIHDALRHAYNYEYLQLTSGDHYHDLCVAMKQFYDANPSPKHHLYCDVSIHGKAYAGNAVYDTDGTLIADHYWKIEPEHLVSWATKRASGEPVMPTEGCDMSSFP